ncbi:MAG: hypothetical protein WCG20_01460 [bacterium]
MRLIVVGYAAAGLIAALSSVTLPQDIIIVSKPEEDIATLHSFEQVLLAKTISDINRLEATLASSNEYVLYDFLRATGFPACSNTGTRLISNIVCCKHNVRQSQHPP